VPPSARGPWRTLALRCPELSDVEMKKTDRIALEPLLLRLVAVHLREARDAMPLKASMHRRAGEMQDRWLQSIQAVLQRKQNVPTKSHNDSVFLFAETCRMRFPRPGLSTLNRRLRPPLCNGLRIDAELPAQLRGRSW